MAVIAGGIVALSHTRNAPASAAPVAPLAPLQVALDHADGHRTWQPDPASRCTSPTDLAAGSPMPTLSPPIAGAWSVLSPSLLQYQATGPLVPGATETITIPGGPSGVVGSRGQHLAATVTSTFTVAQGSTLRLQQLLAELGYLPLTFTPAAAVTSPAQEGNDQVGTFSWRWPDQAAALTSLVDAGHLQRDHQGCGDELRVAAQPEDRRTGRTGQVWAALLADLQDGRPNALPYDYVLVTKALPETTTVFSSGVPVYSTLANTGWPRGGRRRTAPSPSTPATSPPP